MQTATVTGGADRLTVAVVHNIVLRVRGSALVRRTPLMLATHYDSVADAPDAAGAVAALLDTLRALRHGPPLREDLIVLIADGEHAASLGARAFVDQHPWARHVGLLLRFDGAAGEGPLTLLGTQGANGNTVQAWAGLDAPTAGSSRAPEADTSPLRTLGLAGMRFSATLAGGEAMLSLVRAFGARPLEAIAAPQRLYFSVPLAGVLHYPEHMVWHITHLACALRLVVCWALLRRGLRIAPLSLAGALALLIVVSAARPGASYLLAWPLIGVLLGVGALYLPLAASLSRHARGAIATAGLLPAVVLLLPLAADPRTPAAAPPAPGITYLADATTWKSYWLDGAAARAVSEAPRSGIAFPQVEMLKDEDSPVRRKVAFALTSNNAAPTIALRVEGARVLAARLDGRALAARRFGGWTLTLHGMGERRLPIELELEGGRPARILIEESIPGLPADTVPTRRIDAPRNGRILATDTLLLR